MIALEDALRVYVQAWNETDDQTRLELLESVLEPDAVLFDPMGVLKGPSGVNGFIGKVRAQIGTAQLVYTSAPQPHPHGPWVRYAWAIVATAGQPIMEGMDVIELAEDGRFRRVVSFSGRLAGS
jgi:hypothetical protein